jgi:hypothetical protein
MHVYTVVGCKTQNWRTVHVLTHLGEKEKTPAKVEYWMSYPLMIDCPTCGGDLRLLRFRGEILAKGASACSNWLFQ